MEINYSEKQFESLDKRFDFMRSVKTSTMIAAIVLTALFIGGICLINYGLVLLGLILAIVMFLPAALSFFAWVMMSKFFRVLRKHKANIIEINCQAWVREEDNRLWHRVTDYNGNEYYYFTEDNEKNISAGEKLHVITYKSIFVLPIAFDPISATVDDNQVEESKTADDELAELVSE